MNFLEDINNQLFLAVNGPVGSPAWLVEFAKAAGDDLVYLVPLLLIGLWLQGGSERRGLALRAFAAVMLGLGLNQIIGLAWHHPRPFMVGLGHAWIAHAPDSSFPSDHATIFFAMALALLMGGARRLAVAVLACALSVAWARVFLGVHYPLDMAGAALAAIAAWAMTAPLWKTAGAAATDLAERAYRQVFARPIAAGWVKS